MKKKPNWDLKRPAPGTAFKILLLSSTFETAARTLAGCIYHKEASGGATLKEAATFGFLYFFLFKKKFWGVEVGRIRLWHSLDDSS